MPHKKKRAHGETVEDANAHAQDMMMTPEMMMSMMQQGIYMGQGENPPMGMPPQRMPPGMMQPGMMPGMLPGMMPGMQPGMMPGMQPGMMPPGMYGMQPNRPPPGMMQGMPPGMQPGMMPGMPPPMMANQMDIYGGYGTMDQQQSAGTHAGGDFEAAAREKADRELGLHITIDTHTIKFDPPNGHEQCRRITVKNLSDTKRVAFKVQTNKPDMYLVTPSKGVMVSGKTEVIEVEMKATVTAADINKDKNNHKFNIQTMPWSECKKHFDVALWDKDKKSDALKTVTVKVEPCV